MQDWPRATVSGLWPRSCRLSPARSRTRPSFEQQTVPGTSLVAGSLYGKAIGGVRGARGRQPQPSPPRAGQPTGEGEATRRIPAADGEGSGAARVSEVERSRRAGAGNDGGRAGSSQSSLHPPGPGSIPCSTAGMKVSLLPQQCCSWVTGDLCHRAWGSVPWGSMHCPMSCLPWEKKSLGTVWQGIVFQVIFPI